MTRFLLLALTTAWLAALSARVAACTLCNGAGVTPTFREEIALAHVVLYGTLENPKHKNGPNDPQGAGTTDFQVHGALKSNPVLGNRKKLELRGYFPVLDPKDPPKYLTFFKVKDGVLDDYAGRQLPSWKALDYIKKAQETGDDRVKALQYYFTFLDHEEAPIAGDAFMEFARSSDEDIGKVARLLSREKLRRLVENPKTPPEALSLFAFLLGACGDEADADLLRRLMNRQGEGFGNSLDGLLAGYIQLRPKQGWELTYRILGDRKQEFTPRFAAVRTLRFYHNWKGTQVRGEVLRGHAVMLDEGDMADLASENLRQWQIWDLTAKILAVYGQKGLPPITRRAIIRYALCCPLPEAREFINLQRQTNGAEVRELERLLEFEKQAP